MVVKKKKQSQGSDIKTKEAQTKRGRIFSLPLPEDVLKSMVSVDDRTRLSDSINKKKR